MVNDISKCSKLAQKKFKARHSWVGEIIRGELCKRLKFDHITKLYMHKAESVLENEMHRILWDFFIYRTYLIPARRLDLVLIRKKNLPSSGQFRENKSKRKYRQILGTFEIAETNGVKLMRR